MSCAPAAKPATSTPPAATPSTAPAKPAVELATFTSDQYGFSVQYPKSWTPVTKEGYELFATDGTETTADTVFVAVVPKAADLANAAKDYLDNSPTFKKYDVKCDIVSQKQATLADGKTPCTQAVLHVTIIIYSINIYAVGATKGDNSVLAIAYTFGTKTEKIQEICNSLIFK